MMIIKSPWFPANLDEALSPIEWAHRQPYPTPEELGEAESMTINFYVVAKFSRPKKRWFVYAVRPDLLMDDGMIAIKSFFDLFTSLDCGEFQLLHITKTLGADGFRGSGFTTLIELTKAVVV